MENQESRIVKAKNIEEAIEVAMHELDAARDELEVAILDRGKPGFLGLGSEMARIQVRKLTESEAGQASAMESVSTLLRHMRVSAVSTLVNAHDQESGGPTIDIEGEDSGLLIGRKGETLRAMQFVVNLIVNKNRQSRLRVLLDVEQYRDRKHTALGEMAKRVADRVASTSRPITLEPMAPDERRAVHIALADHPTVTTESTGLGTERRVSINPKL